MEAQCETESAPGARGGCAGLGLPAIGDVVSVRGCVCPLRVCLSVVVKNFTVKSSQVKTFILYSIVSYTAAHKVTHAWLSKSLNSHGFLAAPAKCLKLSSPNADIYM